MKTAPDQPVPWIRLWLLTAAAVAIHGYHLGVEDSEIYVPAARKLLHPNLYPYAAEFFQSHERLSLFAPVLAWTARLTHLSLDWSFFLWYVVSLFAALLGCWMLAVVCFQTTRARWSALLVMACVLTMPATNTGLLLMDPYLTARSLSTPLTLFALAAWLRCRYILAIPLTLLTAAFHPQMAAYLIFFAAILWAVERAAVPAAQPAVAAGASVSAIYSGFQLSAAPPPYSEALYSRSFFFLSTWTWYHWLGLLAPLAFLAWFWKGKLRGTTPAFARLSFVLLPFGAVSILAAAVISSSHTFDMLERLQPLRAFHLITLLFMLLLGGVIGEYWARGRAWVIPALCLPLAAGMAVVAWQTYPASPHIEWPGYTASSNAWVGTLLWIRRNTPSDAVFAVDSRYFKDPEVDVHGFRALSERSELADYYKDGGVVAMFPELAVEWKQMSNATYGLNRFSKQDFARLAHEYPVTWTVVHGAAPAGMNCPYQQHEYTVCRIPETQGPMLASAR